MSTKPVMILHSQKSVDYTVFDARWIPTSAKFISVGSNPNGTGNLEIFEITQKDGTREVASVQTASKNYAFRSGTFGASLPGQRFFATGDFEGNLDVWDVERLTSSSVYNVNAHNALINCVDGVGGLGIGEGAPEIATASRDGCVYIWDTRQKDHPVMRFEPSTEENKRDCWTVAFGNAYNVSDRSVAAGFDNGDIKLFDMRAAKIMWESNTKNGVCCLEFDRKDISMNKLVATCVESRIFVYDLKCLHPEKGFVSLTEKAHKSTIWAVRHLPQNRDVFATCGGTGSIYLWKYNYPASRTKKDASSGKDIGVIGSLSSLANTVLGTQPISSFDWNRDMIGLACASGLDQCVRVVVVAKLNLL